MVHKLFFLGEDLNFSLINKNKINVKSDLHLCDKTLLQSSNQQKFNKVFNNNSSKTKLNVDFSSRISMVLHVVVLKFLFGEINCFFTFWLSSLSKTQSIRWRGVRSLDVWLQLGLIVILYAFSSTGYSLNYQCQSKLIKLYCNSFLVYNNNFQFCPYIFNL